MALKSTTPAGITAALTQIISKQSRNGATANSQLKGPTPVVLPANGRCLVRALVTIDGAIAEASLTSLRGAPGIVLLTDVYTSPKLRGRGLARRVIYSVLEEAEKQGWHVLTFAKPHGRGPKLSWDILVGFYKSFGFEETTPGLLHLAPK